MKILDKKILAQDQTTRIIQFIIHSPDISKKAEPGQFVVVMIDEKGERIPLTVVDTDTKKETITLIVQELGFSTKALGKMEKGESLYALVGPMGHATCMQNYGKIILVGGGVGIAEIYPVAKGLKEAGNHITSILGSRTKDLLILEKKLKSVSNDFHITTDDGSSGRKGFTTDVLKELLSKNKYDFVYGVGPIPMMEKVSMVTKDFNTKTFVSLNAIMIDATGMCGGCRVLVNGKVKFSCVDGPEFDGHLVDWNELKTRSKTYIDKENHICNLNK